MKSFNIFIRLFYYKMLVIRPQAAILGDRRNNTNSPTELKELNFNEFESFDG